MWDRGRLSGKGEDGCVLSAGGERPVFYGAGDRGKEIKAMVIRNGVGGVGSAVKVELYGKMLEVRSVQNVICGWKRVTPVFS